MQAVALTGAIAAGVGVILFFAANWDAITRPARVVLLLAALLGSYAAGQLVLERRPLVGHALIVLGTIVFGAGIVLVAQMFHVQARDRSRSRCGAPASRRSHGRYARGRSRR